MADIYGQITGSIIKGINSSCYANGNIYLLTVNYNEDATCNLFIYKSSDCGENWELMASKNMGVPITYANFVYDWENEKFHIVYDDALTDKLYYRYYDFDWSGELEIYDSENGTLEFFYLNLDSSGQCHVGIIASETVINKLYYRRQINGVWQDLELVYECGPGEQFQSPFFQLLFDGENPVIIAPLYSGNYTITEFIKTEEWNENTICNGIIMPASQIDYNSGNINLYYINIDNLLMIKYREKINGYWTDEETFLEFSEEGATIIYPFLCNTDKNGKKSVLFLCLYEDYSSKIFICDEGNQPRLIEGGDEDYYSLLSCSYNQLFGGKFIARGIELIMMTETLSIDFEGQGIEFGILSVTPNYGAINKIIEINGNGFGNQQENSRVVFQKENKKYYAQVTEWSNTKIKCYSPEIDELDKYNVFLEIVDN